MSFYLAIFLGLLLFVSGGLNLVLMFVTAVGSAAGFSPAVEVDGRNYEVVAVAGDLDAEDRILRVPINGAIAEASSPLLGASGGTVSQVRRALSVATRDDSIKGVLLDINSPGGGVTDSDEIHRLLTEFQSESGKPVHALFGDMSASGGYYIAAACSRIQARYTTITGSIGVIMNSTNYGEAAKKLGIESVVIKSDRTPFKDMMSPTRPMLPEEKAVLTSIVDEMLDRFIKIVDEGRPGLDRAEATALANGQIYSANQALDNGLVDALGSVDDAYEALKQELDIEKARIIEHRRRPSFTEVLFGAKAQGPSIEQTLSSLMTATGPRFLYYWPGGR